MSQPGAEDALRHSQALYHSLVNQMPAGVYRKDAAGRYVFVNRWFCNFFGLAAADCLDKTPMEVAAGDLANPRKKHLKEEARKKEAQGAVDHHTLIMQSGKPIETEEKHIQADGSVRYLRVVKTAVFDSTGAIVGSQGIQFEVTQQKQAQSELAYERDLFTALMENFPDSIYFKDLQSRFVRVSKSKAGKTLKLLAGTPQEQQVAEKPSGQMADVEEFEKQIIGKTDFDFLPREFAEVMFQEEQEIIRTGKPLLMKLDQAVFSDGKKGWYFSTKLPWRDREGKIIGTFGTTKDITVFKEAEAKLEQVHKELLIASRQAGMAEVASNVLHNVGNVLNSVNVSATLAADIARKSKVSGLAKAVSLLEEHSEDLGGFMTADPKGQQIPGYLRRLYDHLAQEQQASVEELESLRKNIEHIKDIVNMQQNYAKMSGLTEVVKVADLVEDSLRMNAGALQRHEVQVVREYEEVPAINVEKHKVLQILVNLIRNAKYACDEGGAKEKRVEVRIVNGESGVKISVGDNGVGIPAENLMRIFNHGFTTRKTGHGFGLHSGALAAKEMGGTLAVHSAGPGQGAVFTLELPVNKSGEEWKTQS
ncbi:MAG TPA: PAS domain-containing sensor histidine kinase [Verrucomicrobiae bacterium]|nr:PAS domain-containing sensor histidine kinase [Verrucomicrobiae bacterium]